MFAASKTGGVVSAGDPYWTSVSLLTNFENNLSFQDGSTNNFAITRNGGVNPSLNTPFSGGVGGSEWFNGASTGTLTAANNAAFQFGSGNFTIEFWIYPLIVSGIRQIINPSSSGGSVNLTYAVIINGTACTYYLSSTGTTWDIASGVSIGTVAANTWYHVALVRNGTTITPYLNGVAGTTTTSSSSLFAFTSALSIGGYNGSLSDNFFGNISNLRIVKGTAVYTTTFTPPTAPLTAIANTSLLITGTGQGMFDNATFVDQGPNALTVTATGAPVYSGLSPFGNTYPGSVYFNGSNNLSAANSATLQLGSGNATVEFWVYAPSVAALQVLINTESGGGGVNTSYAILINSGTISYYLSSNGTTWNIASAVSIGSISANTWTHVALVRNGNTWTPYLNGTAGTTTTNVASLYNFTSALSIGQAANASYFTGYISNLRIIKGTAVYTANFTPSTTPLTAITNTSLLVRGDTGAFYDLSNNGNSMTSTGATAVTTQVKKYGAESASYTATSYQTVTDAINLQLGTGDYTIEAWVYRNAAGVLHSLICKGAAATGWLLQVNSSNQLVFTVTSTAILTSTTTIAATTWTFVTVTRSGTSTRLFVGGNLEATATDSTNFNQTNALLVGADRSNANGLNGYLDDIRITKGVARYTANFTPPTVTFPTGP